MAIKACNGCKGFMYLDPSSTQWLCVCGYSENVDGAAVAMAKSVLNTNLAEASVQELIREFTNAFENNIPRVKPVIVGPKPPLKEFALPPLPKTGITKIPSFTSKPVTTITLDKQGYEDLIHYARKALKFIAHIPLDSPAFNVKTAREAHDLVHCLMQAIGTLTGERNGEV